MLVVTVAAVLVYFSVQKDGASAAPGKACWLGNPSGVGNGSCVAPEPYLIFGHGKAIYRMDLDGGNQKRVVTGVGNSILLDFHYTEGRVYWADKKTGVIYKAAMDGTQRQKLHSSQKGISGLAVDWVHNFVIWTSGEVGSIKRVDTDGKNERTLLRHLSQPISIAVAPNDRFIFWLSDGITPSIQRSDVAGEMITTVLKIPERLGGLSVDRTDKRLFWVQFSLEGESAIGSCDYNGNVVNVIDQPLLSQSLGMSVFLEQVFYTDMSSRTIRQVNKYSGVEAENINLKRMTHPPTAVKVVHPLNQPIEDSMPVLPVCDGRTGVCVNVCSNPAEQGICQCTKGFALSKHGNYCEDVNECGLWDHGCSLGCENIPGSYFCTCPKGYALLPDRKTCHETSPCLANMTQCDNGCLATGEGTICVCPEGSLLQPDGQTCRGCTSSDRGGCSQQCSPITPGRWECDCLPGYKLHQDGKRCTATGPPPYLLFANIVNIRRVNLDGTGDQSLVEEPSGTVIALDYDPVQNKVYFASTVLKQIERADLDGGSREVLLTEELDSPEGLAVDWVNRKLYWTDRGLSTIDRSTLDGFDRETIISKGIQKPRGIAVHPLAKKLFWTDMGTRPVLESASLEGSDRAVIASADLVSPSGLTIDFTEDRLYWCDSKRGVLETASLDGSNRQVLTENEVGQPFDLAVFEDRLWITDREQQLLLSIDKWTGMDPERLHGNMVQPASIVVVHPLAKPGANVCLYRNGGCAQVCESRLGFAHCSCHSHIAQSADGKACLPSYRSTDSGDGESADPFSLKNKTLNDESMPLPVPGLPTDGEEAEDNMDEGSEPTLFIEKMVSDQDDCFSLRCDVNAQCLLDGGNPTCHCLEGFTGDGELCVDLDECTLGMALCSIQSSVCVNTAGGYYCQCRPGFSGEEHHCTDFDECKMGTHKCDERAECINTIGKYRCKCQAGYSGNGHTCQELSTTSSWVTTSRPMDVTSQWLNTNTVESCPSSHDTYCLYEGVCFYFPEMESYACNCISGYMGERCQFSDLEWWELQQAEQEKRRNVAIALGMVVLITLLSIAACVTYCYGSRRFVRKHPSVDDMSDTSTSDDTMSETTVPKTPRFYVVLEHGGDGKVIHVMGCPRRAVCPSCSSETGESFVSEEAVAIPKLNKGYECSFGLATMETNKTGANHLKSIDNLIFLDDPQPASAIPQLT
ncbi:pro-epidermal growth factor [Oncorhynchus nerka]|uniref:pro-epidermal growth factor n=1 Tax=Oncorhynchus nerka TaxID=8023 RepID=UPI0031B806A6